MKAMWRWPSRIRCSVASWQPRKLSVPTKSRATSGTWRTTKMVGIRRLSRLSKKLWGVGWAAQITMPAALWRCRESMNCCWRSADSSLLARNSIRSWASISRLRPTVISA
ncbi:hypothetical protein D3C81_1861720 [compost metagenome]